MRQIYKDIVIGMILASFTFTPVAFAKPRATKVMRGVIKAPLYTELFKTVKANRKKLKVSQFVESSAPMVKKREMRNIKKLALPFWDKRVQKFTIGKDYAKIKVNGKSLFIRYVDRGPVAFIVNKKPFLWKDVLIYSRAKARMTEILTGRKRSKKVSFIDSILNDLFPKAHAIGKRDRCVDLGGAPRMDGQTYQGCQCPNDGPFNEPNVMPTCPTEVVTPEPTPEPIPEPTPQPNKPGLKEYGPLIAMGLLVLVLILLRKKKKRGTLTPVTPVDPVPGWTPEGTCPTPGARGLTEADLPPECRTSSCADTNSCGDTNNGVIDGY